MLFFRTISCNAISKEQKCVQFLRIRLFQEINKTSISAVYFRSYLLGLNKFDFCKSIFIK